MRGRPAFGLGLAVLAAAAVACGGGETATEGPDGGAIDQSTEAPADVPFQGVIIEMINDVDAHPLPDDDWEDAAIDMPIYQGGEVWAQESSTARVEMDIAVVRVAPNTIFTLDQPDEDETTLTLDEGQVWVNVEGLDEGQTFQVETPDTVASVRGTRFSARIDGDGNTIVSTRAGTVTVGLGTDAVTVTEGLQTVVMPGDVPAAPTPMTPEEQVRWGMAMGSRLHVRLPAIGDPGVLTYTGSVFSTDWSPDGQYFAYVYSDPLDTTTTGFKNAFYDTGSGSIIESPLSENAGGVFFNPTGDGLAYQSLEGAANFVCTADLDGATRDCFGGRNMYGWPFWSPDGSKLLVYTDLSVTANVGGGLLSSPSRSPSGQQGALNLVLFTSELEYLAHLTTDQTGFNIRQNWSPDGKRIAFVRNDDYVGPGDVWIMDADGGNQQMVFEGIYGNGFDHVSWSPDGEYLVTPKQDSGGLWLVPTDGSDPWLAEGTEGWDCWDPVWSPVGDGWPLFFYSQYDEDLELGQLWVIPAAGEEPESLGYVEWGPKWTPYGQYLSIGFAHHSGDVPEVEVLVFPAQPDFWMHSFD